MGGLFSMDAAAQLARDILGASDRLDLYILECAGILIRPVPLLQYQSVATVFAILVPSTIVLIMWKRREMPTYPNEQMLKLIAAALCITDDKLTLAMSEMCKRRPTMVFPIAGAARFGTADSGCVYVGSAADATNEPMLGERKIQFIVNATAAVPNHFEDSILYLRVCNLEELTAPELCARLDEAIAFVSAAMEKRSSVLVHCHQGFTVSAIVAAAFLMHRLQMTMDQALEQIALHRVIFPSAAQKAQLRVYETHLSHSRPSPSRSPRNLNCD